MLRLTPDVGLVGDAGITATAIVGLEVDAEIHRQAGHVVKKRVDGGAAHRREDLFMEPIRRDELGFTGSVVAEHLKCHDVNLGRALPHGRYLTSVGESSAQCTEPRSLLTRP